MKSFSTTSLVEEIEKEDRIKELENMLVTQKSIIDKQFQRIMELEKTSGGLRESKDLVSEINSIDEEKECLSDNSKDGEAFEEESFPDASTVEELNKE